MKNKKRPNPIPKTLRGKKRYFVIAFFSNKQLQAQTVFESLRTVFLSLFGSVGLAKARLSFRGFESASNRLVVQADLASEKALALAIASIQRIGAEPVAVKTVLKTGSLQKALDKAKQ